MKPHSLALIALAFAIPISNAGRAEVFDVDAIKLPAVKRTPKPPPRGGIETLEVIDDPDATALLGKGFDVFTGEVKADAACVESDGHDGPTPQNAPPGSGDDVFFNDTFTSIHSFTNSSKSGVSLGFTYKIISASFENDNSTESELNSTDSFGRFFRRIITQVQFRDGGKWSRLARKWLERRDIKSFIEGCGTHYVRSIYWGHSLDQVLRFKLKDGSRTSTNSDKLSVGVGQLLNFGVTDSTSATSVDKLSSITHSGHNHGAIVAPELTNDVASVLSLYQFVTYKYPKAIADSKLKGDVLLLDIRPYRERPTLDLRERIPKWPEEIFTELKAKQELVSGMGTAILNLRFASKLSKTDYEALYSAPAFDELPARLKAIVKAQTTLKAAVDACELLAQSSTTPAATARAKCKSDIDTALGDKDIKAATLVKKL